MVKTDFNNRIADDKIQGLGYRGDPTLATINVTSFSFGAGARQTFETTVPMTETQVMVVSNVRFSGVGNAHVNNRWAYVISQFFFRNSTPSYDTIIVIDRIAGFLRIRVQFYNPTGAGVTVPNITVDIKSYFYAPSW